MRESATAAASPAVATACAAQERRAEAARRRIGRSLANSEIAEAATDLGVCHHGAGGAWVLEAGVSANRTARIDGSQVRFEIRWQLVFVTARGALVRSRTPTQPMSNDPRRSRVVFFSAIHDFNRDGVSEAALVVRENATSSGEPEETMGALYSVAGGAVAPLPSAAAVTNVVSSLDLQLQLACYSMQFSAPMPDRGARVACTSCVLRTGAARWPFAPPPSSCAASRWLEVTE